jgi:hypothetical protein
MQKMTSKCSLVIKTGAYPCQTPISDDCLQELNISVGQGREDGCVFIGTGNKGTFSEGSTRNQR